MKFPVHKDERGEFQELAHNSDVKFGQLSLLKVNPNCERGGHYHKRKDEWFCCIYGKCVMEIVHVQSCISRSVVLDESNKEFVYIAPYERHSVRNVGKEVCELLVIISEAYNQDDPDTETE